jgi:uncharacterized protein (DUF983 family)
MAEVVFVLLVVGLLVVGVVAVLETVVELILLATGTKKRAKK